VPQAQPTEPEKDRAKTQRRKEKIDDQETGRLSDRDPMSSPLRLVG
jgi:hypothetical protein